MVVIAEYLYLGVLIACELVVFDLDAVSIYSQAYVSSVFEDIILNYCLVSVEMQGMVFVVFEDVA